MFDVKNTLRVMPLLLLITLMFSGCRSVDVLVPVHEGSVVAGIKAFDAEKYYQALHEFYDPANEGDKVAQYYFGLMYVRGLAVKQNEDTGVDWLRKSSKQDYVPAMTALARFYREGIYLEKDDGASFKWYMKAAKNDSAEAQFVVASSYANGDFKIKPNAKKAFTWMEQSSKQGYGAAQNGLALMYYHGIGVEKDSERALLLFKKSVARDVAAAKYNLALFYLDGSGGFYDPVEAHALMKQAAIAGYQEALESIGRVDRELAAYEKTINLFGLSLGLATRDEMNVQLKKLGAVRIVTEDSVWTDVYDSQSVTEDTDRLSISYSLLTGKVANIQYRYPGMNTPEGVVELFNRVLGRYGEPDENAKMKVDLEGIYYTWTVRNVSISMVQGWPDTDLLLNYDISGEFEQMLKEQSNKNLEQLQAAPPVNVM